MKKLFEKSLVASKNLDKGTLITESDLLIRKPGTGLSSKYKKKLIGKKIKKKYLKFEIISKNEVF
jgi:N-acetylneuraminate synthase